MAFSWETCIKRHDKKLKLRIKIHESNGDTVSANREKKRIRVGS